jgi:hypothetical protein
LPPYNLKYLDLCCQRIVKLILVFRASFILVTVGSFLTLLYSSQFEL